MQLTLLRLYSIVNQPLTLKNAKEGWLALDDKELPTILIFKEELAKKILKSEFLPPIDLISFFKEVNDLNSNHLPFLSNFFIKTPLLLKGENHFRTKASLIPIYKYIEKDLSKWVDIFVANFFDDKKINKTIDPITLAEAFVCSFFKEIISREIGISHDEIPDLPDDVLNISPKKISLEMNEKKLANLILFLKNKLDEKGRDEDEAWVFSTIALMGSQALRSAVIFALLKAPVDKIWDEELLFSKASPISVIGRIAMSDTKIDNLCIKKGQTFFISLSMINESSIHQIENFSQSFAFGSGPHKCPGRKISGIVMKALLNFWKIHHADFVLDQVKFTRTVILEAK
jgi:hypothetical protein